MNKHLNNWLDEAEGLAPETTNNNIQKEIDSLSRKQPRFYAELVKQGFVPQEHTDDKTGKKFIGWSKQENPILTETILNFKGAINDGLLQFVLEDNWLSVNYKNVEDAEGKEVSYHLLCAQDINDFNNAHELTNRITLMLADKLRSVKQDLNYTL